MPLFGIAFLFLLLFFPPTDASAAGKWTSYINAEYVNMVAQEGDTLWCASDGGIVRFDTRTDTYTVFNREFGYDVSGAYVVHIGSDGVKWFGRRPFQKFDGVSWTVIDPTASGFIQYLVNDYMLCKDDGAFLFDARFNAQLGSGAISGFVCYDGKNWANCPTETDTTGTSAANPDDVWFLTGNNSIERFDGKKIVQYDRGKSPAGKVTAFAKDREGVVWLISDRGIVSYDCREWKTYASPPELEGRTLGSAVFVDRNNVKWFRTSGGFIAFDGTAWRSIGAPDFTVESFFEDHAGNHWFGTRSGLYRYDGASWTGFEHDIQIAAGSTAKGMRIVGEDSRGRLWIYYDPLFHPGLYSFNGEGFTYHPLSDRPTENLANTVIVDHNNVKWFGFTSERYLCISCYQSGGLSSFDGRNWKHYTKEDGLGTNRIHSLAVDRDNTLWVGNQECIVNWFDGTSWGETFDLYTLGDLKSIAVDKSNVKWFAAQYRGLARYDGDAWTVFDKNSAIPDIKINSLAVDRDNILWAGTQGGAWSFDGTAWTRYTVADGLADSLTSRVAVDSCNVKWFGSQGWEQYDLEKHATVYSGGGLTGFDGKTWRRYTTVDGLVDNRISALCVGRDNALWIGATGGLSRFDGSSFKNWTVADGLVSNAITAIAEDQDGVLWITTSGGISRFEPDDLTSVEDRNAKPAALAITGNRPNPFNPSTTISFTLPSSGKATMTIYDITGRKVRTLVSGSLSAGAHSAVWDGRDEHGVAVSSGVYIARLRMGETSASCRMLLVK